MIPTIEPKQNMITGTTIRPNRSGKFPQLEPGLYSVALGNMSQFDIYHAPVGGGLIVGVAGKSCYIFGHAPHAGYVEEKLRVMDGDAGNIADYISDQIGGESERQGQYSEKLTTEY